MGDEEMIALEKPKYMDQVSDWWKESPPFVENRRGTLIHRIKAVAVYKIHKAPHIAAEMWCGMHLNDSQNNLSFVDDPDDGLLLCRHCEAKAVASGGPSASDLAGRHIHIGALKPVKICCVEK